MSFKRDPKDALIIALDMTHDHARYFGIDLKDSVNWLKVGMTLFNNAGPFVVRELKDLGHKVFVDLKLHDIPSQVYGAAYALGEVGADMMTVHASGGVEMMKKAIQGARDGAAHNNFRPPIVLAVTVLTSMDDAGLKQIGVNATPVEQVKRLAALALEADVDGVVCSAEEASLMREILGPDKYIVTPGIRLESDEKGDQSRITTPSQAIKNGATHIVVGRPITMRANRVEAINDYLAEIEKGQ